MPLPHYSNISTHNQKWEPVWKSLFEITFSLPPILNRTVDEVKLLLENTNSITLPTQPEIAPASQRFKFDTRAFVSLPKQTHIEDLTLKFSLNQNDRNSVFVWNILKAWYDLAWNQMTGETHIKSDMCGSIIVNLHDKTGKVYRRVTYRNVQIIGVDGLEYNWESTSDIHEATAKFICDYWEDLYNDEG